MSKVGLTLRAVRLKRIEEGIPDVPLRSRVYDGRTDRAALGFTRTCPCRPRREPAFSRLLPFGFLAVARLADQPSRR